MKSRNASKKPTEVYIFLNTEFRITAYTVLKVENRQIWTRSTLVDT